MSLSEKQLRFVEEYMIDLNATAAAERAGYAHPNKQGPRLLVNVGIQEEIQKRRQAVSAKAELTAADVIRGLHKEANDHGDGTSQAGRVSAWAWLGKTFGMFKDVQEHDIKGVVKKISYVVIPSRSRTGPGTVSDTTGLPDE